jgi:hypothetical protein
MLKTTACSGPISHQLNGAEQLQFFDPRITTEGVHRHLRFHPATSESSFSALRRTTSDITLSSEAFCNGTLVASPHPLPRLFCSVITVSVLF